MADSWWLHGLQQARLPCPSPSPGVCSNSCPLSWWGHPTISSSVAHFSCPPSFPSQGLLQRDSFSYQVDWTKYWSFSFNISPSNEYSGFISFRIDWPDLLAVQGTFKSFLQHPTSKASILEHWIRLQHRRPQIDFWVRKICWGRDRLSSPAFLGFPGGSAGKESAFNVGDLGLIPGMGRPPGEVKGCPLQYSGLENSMDCIVHRIAKNWTQLSHFHFHIQPSLWSNSHIRTWLLEKP